MSNDEIPPAPDPFDIDVPDVPEPSDPYAYIRAVMEDRDKKRPRPRLDRYEYAPPTQDTSIMQQPEPKAGRKTSEFVVTVATVIGSLAVATGILSPAEAGSISAGAEAIVQAAGAIGAAATAIGYAISRARVKIGR